MQQMEPLYRNLTSGAEVVESQLGESFAEYLNAEIALRNIVDMEGARHWLSSTFLYVRVSSTCLEGWQAVLANECHISATAAQTYMVGALCLNAGQEGSGQVWSAQQCCRL